jgi:cation diffusion facilitator CzcD-associated flavoprotein CzcO
MDDFDLVIVGAGKYILNPNKTDRSLNTPGIYGIQVAKTYLEVHPTSKLLLLDAGQSVGGTWSTERLYEGLNSNNLVGMLEFSNFPMSFETFGVAPGCHVPGEAIQRYLTAYAVCFGVFDKIRFGAEVETAELQEDDSWLISYMSKVGREVAEETKVLAKKMVFATGSTSEPNIPSIKGSDVFGGHIFHSKEFPIRTHDMRAAKHIAVLGGSQSAGDAVYLNATKGRHVDWIIRGKRPN